MKRLSILVLLALTGLVRADPGNPCNLPETSVKMPYIDMSTASAAYECAPKPLGAGTLPSLRSNQAGTVAWWYCPIGVGAWRLNWAAATADRLSAHTLFAELQEVVTAKDPKAAFNAITARNAKTPLSDPSLTAVWCPFAAEMVSGAPVAATKPQASAASDMAKKQVASAPVTTRD
jgi:hypothetical protein